jgi:hypothetical protein
MQTNILWTGREYNSLEHCRINSSSSGLEIASTIVGSYGEYIYSLDYHIHTDSFWATRSLELRYRCNGPDVYILLEGDGQGRWMLNGQKAGQFQGCTDVDISLTPFTNTLPINRLIMAPHQVSQIRVIYIDVLGGQIRPVDQKYTRLSHSRYFYENVPNDFSAELEVDALGLVADYPGLFVRTAIQSIEL